LAALHTPIKVKSPIIDSKSGDVTPPIQCFTVAHQCSRLGSALRFNEFSDDNLARRWRSQVIDANVDSSVFPKETTDFGKPSNINSFVNNGGKVIIILTPGPFWTIQQRLDRPWMQELPWQAIQVIE
jgi:hypothetical protein